MTFRIFVAKGIFNSKHILHYWWPMSDNIISFHEDLYFLFDMGVHSNGTNVQKFKFIVKFWVVRVKVNSELVGRKAILQLGWGRRMLISLVPKIPTKLATREGMQLRISKGTINYSEFWVHENFDLKLYYFFFKIRASQLWIRSFFP